MGPFTSADLLALSPLLLLALGAFAVLVADAISRTAREGYALGFVSLGSVVLSGFAAAALWGGPSRTVAVGSLALGSFTLFVSLLILACAAIAVLYSLEYARRMGFEFGEYYGLLLLATTGMLYLVAANDLVSLFIAFELMSLSVYALVAVIRAPEGGERAARAGEGAIKYFVLGSFSSAFLLYGLALMYGSGGTVYLDRLAAAFAGHAPQGIGLAAISLLIVSLAFKVGAVPFHAWVPDAYQAAPASVTGFMAVAVKAAAFATLVRVLHATGLLSGSAGSEFGATVLSLLAVATLVLGNVAALGQTRIQRLLAYSGIAHTGYVLVGLVAATRDPGALAGALFYLVGYAAMTIGAFAVLTVVQRDGRPVDEIEDLAGLARERPAAALAMTVFMVSLIGIPPTAGFMGKLWLFKSAVAAGFVPLVVIAVLTTAVSVYYYLRVVVVMFMSEGSTQAVGGGPSAVPSFGGAFAVATAAVATVGIGMFPSATLEWATRSVLALLGR